MLDSMQQLKGDLTRMSEDKKALSLEIRQLTNANSLLKSQLSEEKNNNRDLRQELDSLSTELSKQKVEI